MKPEMKIPFRFNLKFFQKKTNQKKKIFFLLKAIDW